MSSYIKTDINNLPSGGYQKNFLAKVIRNYKLNVSHGIVTFDCWNKSNLKYVDNKFNKNIITTVKN